MQNLKDLHEINREKQFVFKNTAETQVQQTADTRTCNSNWGS